MKPLIIYHANCTDGFGAAFCAWLKFGDEAEYIPMNYGEEFDTNRCLDREVCILDFSFNRETTLQIVEKCTKMVWLDHHATSKQLAEELQNAKNQRFSVSLDKG